MLFSCCFVHLKYRLKTILLFLPIPDKPFIDWIGISKFFKNKRSHKIEQECGSKYYAIIIKKKKKIIVAEVQRVYTIRAIEATKSIFHFCTSILFCMSVILSLYCLSCNRSNQKFKENISFRSVNVNCWDCKIFWRKHHQKRSSKFAWKIVIQFQSTLKWTIDESTEIQT